MSNIKALTGLRGIAAALVAWGHFHHHFPTPTRITLWVDLFFILSGFVITLAYNNRMQTGGDYLRFLFLRLGRIYPVHLFSLLLAILAIGYVNAMNAKDLFVWRDTVTGIWQNIFLVNAWPPFGRYSWNMPAWSISAEWSAYLAFPLLLLISHKFRQWFLLLILIGWIAFYSYRDGSGFGAGWEFGVHRCLLGFSIGMWLWSIKPPAFIYHDLVTIVAIIGVSSVWYFNLSDWFFVMPVALLILNLSGNNGVSARILSAPPIYGLGLISYSLYMVHYPVFKLWQQYHKKAFPNGMSEFEMLLMGFVLTLIVISLAYASWRLIEEPFRRASKSVIKNMNQTNNAKA